MPPRKRLLCDAGYLFAKELLVVSSIASSNFSNPLYLEVKVKSLVEFKPAMTEEYLYRKIIEKF